MNLTRIIKSHSPGIPLLNGILRAGRFMAVSAVLLLAPLTAWAGSMELLSDEELSNIEAKGFYFRMDLSLEAFTDGASAPQVVLNTGGPTVIPTDTTTNPFQTPLGSVALSGNAQSNINSLVNIIGATSVINVGVNIVSIQNSSNDTIYTSNINTGAQGANFGISLTLGP